MKNLNDISNDVSWNNTKGPFYLCVVDFDTDDWNTLCHVDFNPNTLPLTERYKGLKTGQKVSFMLNMIERTATLGKKRKLVDRGLGFGYVGRCLRNITPKFSTTT